MRYQELYERCLQSIPARIAKCVQGGKRAALGYTSDLDVLIHWDAKVFSGMVETYLDRKPSFKTGDTLDSVSDFVRVVCYLFLNGLGGEIEITSGEVCRELEKRFGCQPALGGTCAQGAAALARVGIPLIAQISDRSQAVCRFLDDPAIRMVSPEGRLVGAMDMVSGKEPVKHFILQYEKGCQIRIGQTDHTIPVSNRLIMDYDDLHKTLPADPAFLRYVEEHAADIASYNISGFNAIISPQILRQTVADMGEHYRRVKHNHPDCVLYLESAHYLSNDSRHMVYEGFAPYLDVLGMNEEELVDLSICQGHPLILGHLPSLLKALEMVHDAYPARGLVVHSKDYAIYYGHPIPGIDMEAALCLGNLLSGTRARIGRYGALEDLEGTLSAPLSPVGLQLAESLPAEHKGRKVFIVPSRYLENPVATIGLGDTFVAGMQIAFFR